METTPRKVVVYADSKGREPYTEWVNGLNNLQDRARIRVKINRLEAGNIGDCASVGDGVHEMKMPFEVVNKCLRRPKRLRPFGIPTHFKKWEQTF